MLYNKTQDVILCEKTALANNFWSRLKGLLGTSKISSDFALIIHSCNQVHMFFMRYPIGVIFMDKNMKVLYKQYIKPWQVSKKVQNARYVVEVNPKTLSLVNIGETLHF